MEKNYMAPEMEITEFEYVDVITTSGEGADDASSEDFDDGYI